MLRDSVVVVVAVMRTRPRAIPLAMMTMGKSTHGFPFLSYMSMGLRLATLRAAGAPLLHVSLHVIMSCNKLTYNSHMSSHLTNVLHRTVNKFLQFYQSN